MLILNKNIDQFIHHFFRYKPISNLILLKNHSKYLILNCQFLENLNWNKSLISLSIIQS